jgi:protein gp37
VWLGVSVEDQAAADARIPELLATPAAVRFLSCEPLLGPVTLWPWLSEPSSYGTYRIGRKRHVLGPTGFHPPSPISWVIAGGESGPRARPCDLAWIRSLVEQCRAAGVATFVKQLGSRPVVMYAENTSDPGESAHPMKLRDRKGGDMEEWPSDLRVREFPEVRA